MSKTPAEMWELASALHVHGSDVDKLATVLPHWPKSDLAHILGKFKSKARREQQFIVKGMKASQNVPRQKIIEKLKEEPGNPTSDEGDGEKSKSDVASTNLTDSPLVVWSDLLMKVHSLQGTSDKVKFGSRISKSAPINDHSQLLSKTMTYASCLEEHYQGGSHDEASYGEIYKYFGQLLAGEAPTQLRPKSAAKILEMLDRLTAIIGSGAFMGAITALRQQSLSDIQEFQVNPLDCGTEATSSDAASASAGLFEVTAPSEAEASTAGSSLKQLLESLDPQHPYFEEHRHNVNSKLVKAQTNSASLLTNVPGLNPLMLPSSILTKPLDALSDTSATSTPSS